MTPEQVAQLKVLLAQARVRSLTPEERERYLAACTELQDSLIHAQLLLAPKGAKARRAFRAVRELPVELFLPDRPAHARTHDFSIGGFSVLLSNQPPALTPQRFKLSLTDAQGPLLGTASCRGCCKTDDGRWRASFQLVAVAEADRLRLEREVVETAVEMLWPSGSLSS